MAPRFQVKSSLIACALLACAGVRADPWLPPGDLGLRSDIQLLADSGVLRGPVTTELPGSFLQVHGDVDVMLDEAAAAGFRVS